MNIVEKELQSSFQSMDNPLLERVFGNRGLTSLSDLEYSVKNLLPFEKMKGIEDAARLIAHHIKNDSSIVVCLDYDCDGCTAGAICVEGLQLLGARCVNFVVPNRFEHGYGLSPAVVDIIAKYSPDLVITVDNGIASFDGAQAIKKLPKKCDLIITDHHILSPNGLPEAAAIVNPAQPDCSFESKNIAGCGVSFYVIWATKSYMEKSGVWSDVDGQAPSLAPLLDLVALGTVADVVKLDYNNRCLVACGLKWINLGRARPGIMALIKVGNKEVGRIVSSDFGFVIGPRINSCGRLEDMSVGIRCLLTKDDDEALSLAMSLDNLNSQRRQIEGAMVENAYEQASNQIKNRSGLCLFDGAWHEGVNGIVASRVKDKFNRPVICFSQTDNGDLKGSARSIPGVHLKHVLDRISKTGGWLKKYGGHSAAAGLSIEKRDLPRMISSFDEEIQKELTPEMISGRLYVDIADVDPGFLTLGAARSIQTFGPWGQGFEEPCFSAKFDVKEARILKDRHLKLVLFSNGIEFNAIAFNVVEPGKEFSARSIECVFSLSENIFRNKSTLQLVVSKLQSTDISASATD